MGARDGHGHGGSNRGGDSDAAGEGDAIEEEVLQVDGVGQVEGAGAGMDEEEDAGEKGCHDNAEDPPAVAAVPGIANEQDDGERAERSRNEGADEKTRETGCGYEYAHGDLLSDSCAELGKESVEGVNR